MDKRKSNALIHVAITAAFALIIACTVFFIFQQRRIGRLCDSLTKARAYSATVEAELDELKRQYSELNDSYAKLEQTKAQKNNAPVVYLTFDDGPSENTIKILDILDSYNIKATFFVIGKEGGFAAQIYRRLVADGHSVGNHTYTHEYKDIYSSSEKFWAEFYKNDELFFETTGQHLNIMRFPGGSNNTVSQKYCRGIMKTLTSQAKQKGLVYFDWNVTSKDAEKVVQSTSVIINAVLKECRNYKSSIVLMHDNKVKKTTVEALPVIIESLKKDGCIFKTLDENVTPVQFLK